MEERSHHSFINGFLKTELWVDDSSPPQTAQPGGCRRPPMSFVPPLPPSES